jgi:hypothetical protein
MAMAQVKTGQSSALALASRTIALSLIFYLDAVFLGAFAP